MAPTRHSSSSSGHDGMHSLDPSNALGFRSLRDQGSPPPSTPEALEAIFPPIGDYAFLSTVRTPCSSRPPVPSSGCVFPSRTTPASSARSSIDPRDHSASPRSRVPSRPTASTCPERWSSPRPGRPAVAGSKSTTSWLSDRGTGPANVRCCNVEPPATQTLARAGSYRQVPARQRGRHAQIAKPSFNYGRVDAEWEYTGTSYDHVSTTNADYNRITVTGDMRFRHRGSRHSCPSPIGRG